mgnify:CR=1 FL=1
MSKLHLILPMAGRGSRFFENGFVCPKPLIEINGKPFFYWAARSIEKYVDCADITFVVLQEHIRDFAIDEKIRTYWPEARIIALPEVTEGARACPRVSRSFSMIATTCLSAARSMRSAKRAALPMALRGRC